MGPEEIDRPPEEETKPASDGQDDSLWEEFVGDIVSWDEAILKHPETD